MENNELIDLIDEFKSGLLSKATDGIIDEKFYMQERNTLMTNIDNKELIPKFIKSCRKGTEFRRYMQGEAGDYAGCRKIITEGMNELLDYFEVKTDTSDPFAQIKQYRRVEEIGRGGFGAVYKYHNDCLEMILRLKYMHQFLFHLKNKKKVKEGFFVKQKCCLV